MRVVDVVRDGVVESWHSARLVLLDASGSATVSVGPIGEAVYARSSLKPLQATALVDLGFAGRDADLALACASHDGERVHVDGARAVLASAGLDDSALQCPPALPGGEQALLEWVRADGGPARICHNCSGKHAAMLVTCVVAGWATDSYREPDHPLQQAIRAHLESACGAVDDPVVVDGCGAPAFAVPLTGLAAAFAALATAGDGAAADVAAAMRAHPGLLGGTGRAVSEIAADVPGLLCKEGAEGVWAAALPDGRAFAAKLDDGGMRALPPLLAAVLLSWGVDTPAVRRWSRVPVLGGGQPVGEIRPSTELLALLP